MTTVLGVDGGQSGIRLQHSLYETTIEVDGVSRLEGDTILAVVDAVTEAWQLSGFSSAERVMLGLTTAPVDEAESDRLCALIAAVTGADEVWLADDTVTSHAGALSGDAGVSLIAGTGVTCLAAPSDGAPRIIDGHGFLLGDDGGGFWMGRQGLRAVLRASDGRATPTMLTGLAEARFGGLTDLHVRLHSVDRPVNSISQFAAEVMQAASDGDVVADLIVTEAAQHLVTTAIAGISWVGDPALALALGGRVLEPDTLLRRVLDDLLAQEGISSRTADHSALYGAVQLGSSGDLRHYRGLIHLWNKGTPT